MDELLVRVDSLTSKCKQHRTYLPKLTTTKSVIRNNQDTGIRNNQDTGRQKIHLLTAT